MICKKTSSVLPEVINIDDDDDDEEEEEEEEEVEEEEPLPEGWTESKHKSGRTVFHHRETK